MSIHEIDLALLVFGAAVLIGAWRKGFIRPLCDVICLLLSLALTGYFVVRGTIAFRLLLLFLFDSSRARDGAGAASAAAARDPFAF